MSNEQIRKIDRKKGKRIGRIAPTTFQNVFGSEFMAHAQTLFTSCSLLFVVAAGRVTRPPWTRLTDGTVRAAPALPGEACWPGPARPRRTALTAAYCSCSVLAVPAIWRSSTGHVFGLDHRPSGPDWLQRT